MTIKIVKSSFQPSGHGSVFRASNSVNLLCVLGMTSNFFVLQPLTIPSPRRSTRQLQGRYPVTGHTLYTLRIKSLIVRTAGLVAARVLQ